VAAVADAVEARHAVGPGRARDFVPNSIRVAFDWNIPDPARSLSFLPITNALPDRLK